MTRIIVNVIAFQATWFACAFGAAHGVAWVGAIAGLAAVVVHLAMSPQWRSEAVFAVLVGGLGFFIESALIGTGLIDYASAWPSTGLAPLWLVALWMAFATLFAVTLRWLRGRFLLAFVLGGFAGGGAYAAADRIGALSFSSPEWHGVLVVAVVWAIATPMLSRLHGLIVKRS